MTCMWDSVASEDDVTAGGTARLTLAVRCFSTAY